MAIVAVTVMVRINLKLNRNLLNSENRNMLRLDKEYWAVRLMWLVKILPIITFFSSKPSLQLNIPYLHPILVARIPTEWRLHIWPSPIPHPIQHQ